MSNLNLLIIDDEKEVISALKRDLSDGGYNIFTSTSGEGGLEILMENDIHVILSDIRMPEMDGTEFFSRSKVLVPDAIRVAISGYSDSDMLLDSINGGEVWRFLTKPWEDYNLKLIIKDAFDLYSLRKEKDKLVEQNSNLNRELSRMNDTLIEKNTELEGKIGAIELELQVKNKMMNILMESGTLPETINNMLAQISKLPHLSQCGVIVKSETGVDKFFSGKEMHGEWDALYEKAQKSGKTEKQGQSIALPLEKGGEITGCLVCMYKDDAPATGPGTGADETLQSLVTYLVLGFTE